MRTKINEYFVAFFNREPNEVRLNNLCKYFGEKKVLAILTYLTVASDSKVRDGQADNPYGLIYTLGRKKGFQWDEFCLD